MKPERLKERDIAKARCLSGLFVIVYPDPVHSKIDLLLIILPRLLRLFDTSC